MSNFDGVVTADPAWVDVPQLSAGCQALGGPGGPMNAQAVALVARLEFLAQAVSGITAGAALHTGAGVPDAALGANGDVYIDVAAAKIYGPKAGGLWPAGVSLVGPAGASQSGFTRAVVFDTPGTYQWTVPAGVTALQGEEWGPGGGGSRVQSPDSTGKFYKGAGAGGGAYIKWFGTVTPGQVLTIAVGAKGLGAGTGTQATSDSGSDGIATRVTAAGGWTITADSGKGANTASSGAGGVPSSTGTGFTILEAIAGQRGQEALLVSTGSDINAAYYSGNGGAGAKGGTGGWGHRSIPNSANDQSNSGVFPGGGGAGADEQGYAGSGADGKVIILY